VVCIKKTIMREEGWVILVGIFLFVCCIAVVILARPLRGRARILREPPSL